LLESRKLSGTDEKIATSCPKVVKIARRIIRARRKCLELLEAIIPLTIDEHDRRLLLDVDDDDKFEALFCAVAAYAKAEGLTVQYPGRDDQEDIDLEGRVFVPDYERLRIAAASRGRAAVDPQGSKGASGAGRGLA
jgi:hypothetical protein